MKAKLILNLYSQYFEMVICYHIRILGQPSLSHAFQVSTCKIETCVQVFFIWRCLIKCHWVCLTKCHWMCLIECHCFFQLCAKANWVSHICLFYFMNVQVTKLKSLLHIKEVSFSIMVFKTQGKLLFICEEAHNYESKW